MKKTIVLLATIIGIIPAWAQTPPPGTISRPPTPPLPPAAPNQGGQNPAATTNQTPAVTTNQTATTSRTNAFGLSNLSFTNSAGAVYSVDQLASQLQNLRGVIDQTLPMVTAFSETYSNAVPGGPTSLGGAISGILSNVLSRSTNTVASGQTGPQITNLLAALQQSLARNAPAATPANPITFQDVLALQERLQSMPALLQRMNVGSTTNQLAAPSTPAGTAPGTPLPTGR